MMVAHTTNGVQLAVPVTARRLEPSPKPAALTVVNNPMTRPRAASAAIEFIHASATTKLMFSENASMTRSTNQTARLSTAEMRASSRPSQ